MSVCNKLKPCANLFVCLSNDNHTNQAIKFAYFTNENSVLQALHQKRRTHRPELILKLVSTSTSGTQSCVQTGKVLVMPHLDETGHGLCGEADEVQVTGPTTEGQVCQLQVNISDTSFT